MLLKNVDSLRGSFRKEFKNNMEFKNSVSDTEEVYKPHLRYYEQLLIFKDQGMPSTVVPVLVTIPISTSSFLKTFFYGHRHRHCWSLGRIHTKSTVSLFQKNVNFVDGSVVDENTKPSFPFGKTNMKVRRLWGPQAVHKKRRGPYSLEQHFSSLLLKLNKTF